MILINNKIFSHNNARIQFSSDTSGQLLMDSYELGALERLFPGVGINYIGNIVQVPGDIFDLAVDDTDLGECRFIPPSGIIPEGEMFWVQFRTLR